MGVLPQPTKLKKGRDLFAIHKDVKVRRPPRSNRPSQVEATRILDRAIEGFLARLCEEDAVSAKQKCLPRLELAIADSSGNGDSFDVPEAYRLTVTKDGAQILAADALGLRAGLATLAQLLVSRGGVTMLPTAEAHDAPALPMRGAHIDLSCQSLRFDYVCSMIQQLADWKYNAVLLQWGDKFPFQGHRILAHETDAFTPRQVSQVLELAEGLGLVVIPLIHTLTHAEFILKHPQFAHLAEVPSDVYELATSNPESLVLAKQLVDQLIETHPNSPYVHLGGDQARQLGAGASHDQVEQEGKSLAWVEYMNIICRHVQARGRTPIVWDDMLLGHPQALNRFTRDCLLMHWSFDATATVAREYVQPGIGRVSAKTYKKLDPELRDRYEPFWSMGGANPPKSFYTAGPMVYLLQAGFKVIASPAIRSFGDSYAAPRVSHHVENCHRLTAAAAEHNALGVVVSSWSIRRCPTETTIPGLMAAAEAAWSGQATPARDLDARLGEMLVGPRKSDLMSTLDLVGRNGGPVFNAIVSNAWDRRRGRWSIAPLLGRIRRAELDSLTASSDTVKLVRKVQRDAKSASNKLARLTPADGVHGTQIAAWRYAARETAHKAAQWLFFWQVARLVRVDRGSAEKLAKQGAALLDELRRCQRDFKRSVGPTLTAEGLEEEQDLRYGAEARLVRRIVRSLRSKDSRAETRAQIANTLGLPNHAAATS